MAGILSKGIKLYFTNVPTTGSPTWSTALSDLQEIPDLGGTAESIEITTLDDSAHMYMNGIDNYGDSLDFTFLYKKAQFKTLIDLNGAEKYWKVELSDSDSSATPSVAATTCIFKATPSVKLNGAGVNAALTYTLSLKPTSEMVFA